MKEIKNIFNVYDPIILGVILLLLIWSIVNVYSATYFEYSTKLFIKQIIFSVVAMLIILFMPFLDYRKLLNLSPYMYVGGILLLIAVMIFGKEMLGAKRWIKLGFFLFQPSELMKFIMIVLTSHVLDDKRKIGIKETMFVLFLALIPVLLIKKQPDLGTALMVLLPVLVIIFTAGLPKRYMIGLITFIIVASPLIWTKLHKYQKERIIAFLNPEADPYGSAYQIIQSKIAIGSGQLTGKGFLEGTQSKLQFLPEQHTDFIFATIGEEWGFIGSVFVIVLYLILGLRILYWGNKVKHIGAKYVCFGAAGLITLQAFINIAMNTGLAPVVGIPLPFVSYGGTSLLTFSLIIGLVLGVIADYKNSDIHF